MLKYNVIVQLRVNITYNSYSCLTTNIQALYADIGPGTTSKIEGSNVMNMPIYSDPWQVSFLCTKRHVYYLSTVVLLV